MRDFWSVGNADFRKAQIDFFIHHPQSLPCRQVRLKRLECLCCILGGAVVEVEIGEILLVMVLIVGPPFLAGSEYINTCLPALPACW